MKILTAILAVLFLASSTFAAEPAPAAVRAQPGDDRPAASVPGPKTEKKGEMKPAARAEKKDEKTDQAKPVLRKSSKKTTAKKDKN